MLSSKNFAVVFILLSVTVLAIMSNDLYIPSLPYLTEYFSTTEELVQLTLSLNALALGLAQLFIGPLSDRFGRRPLLLIGVVLMGLFSFLCGLAADIYQLLFFRILQGAAAAAEPVLVMAIFTDLFDEKQRVKLFALYGILLAAAPAAAPILGGYVHVHLGWQMNFFILAGLAVLSAVLVFAWLDETIPQKTPKLQPSLILSRYWHVLNNGKFLGFTLMTGLGVAFVFVYITAAPFIYINLHNVAVEHFGFYQAVIIGFYVLGNIIISKLVDKVSNQSLIRAGIITITVGVAALAVILQLQLDSPVTITLAMGLMIFGCAPLFAIAPSIAMGSVDSEYTGSASSLLGAIEMTLAGVVSAMVAVLFDGSAYPMLWIVTAAALFVCFIYKMMAQHFVSEPVQAEG